MKRTVMSIAVAVATLASVAVAAPAHAADRTIELRGPSGAVHSVLTWDDSVDTLCLTLRSTNSSAHATADMRLASGTYIAGLDVSRADTRDCTGNLSIPEDRLAEMRIQGGTSTWWRYTGWAQFYT